MLEAAVAASKIASYASLPATAALGFRRSFGLIHKIFPARSIRPSSSALARADKVTKENKDRFEAGMPPFGYLPASNLSLKSNRLRSSSLSVGQPSPDSLNPRIQGAEIILPCARLPSSRPRWRTRRRTVSNDFFGEKRFPTAFSIPCPSERGWDSRLAGLSCH